ncbi:sugar kinase [Noviherbaspirillum sp.]|uniref:sugar kinase n=1 Tax=Noviherbaspirillum sp. TaxID=1926288 RepID=UPI002D4E951E|nr:sugar kinase [Noviherbaspirillum sp.]HZW20330.1 sugar kinase [Noviherbaspirillum sp.]
MNANECWFLGECMIELRRAGEGLLRQSFAGDVYNTAVYFHRSARTRRTCFVSAAGTDSMSQSLLAQAGKHGIDAGYVKTGGTRPPGLYLIEISQEGERSFLYWRTESAARQMLDAAHVDMLRAHVAACGLFYFSGISLAILDDERRRHLLALASSVKASGGWVGFDSNYRPGLWQRREDARYWSDCALAVATHALVTFDDEAQLHGDASPADTLSRTLATGLAETVVKLGKDGCLLQTSAMDRMLAVPAERADPVDTTAAGDSFNGAYLAARLCGAPPADAAKAGTELAARVIRVAGAIIDEGE